MIQTVNYPERNSEEVRFCLGSSISWVVKGVLSDHGFVQKHEWQDNQGKHGKTTCLRTTAEVGALLGNEHCEEEKERSVWCKYETQERNGSDDSEKDKEVEWQVKVALLPYCICHWEVILRRVIKKKKKQPSRWATIGLSVQSRKWSEWKYSPLYFPGK